MNGPIRFDHRRSALLLGGNSIHVDFLTRNNFTNSRAFSIRYTKLDLGSIRISSGIVAPDVAAKDGLSRYGTVRAQGLP
jgi:hypothetical protein